MRSAEIHLTVNGQRHAAVVPVRKLLLDFLRDDLGLTGTHAGCEHGVCGCCNVLLDGQSVRACLLFAVQADGSAITTVEGLACLSPTSPPPMATGADTSGTPPPGLGEGPGVGARPPLQRAFAEHHALQCGYCTPGMLISAYELLQHTPHPTDHQIREAIAGNLCRCTGYVQIIEAIAAAAASDRP